MNIGSWRSWAPWGGVAAAGILALLASWLLVRPALQIPAPEAPDWAAAATRISEDLAPGDMIRVEPFWSTGGRIWFGDLDGGPPTAFRLLDVHEPADPPWLTRAPRVWIVAAMGYGDELIEDLQGLGFTAGLEEDLGRLRLIRMDRGEQVLRWELVEHLREAVLESFVRARVRRQTRRVAGGPRDCVLIGGDPKDEVTEGRLRWERIKGAGTLWIRAGNTMDSARNRAAGNITVTARAGSEEAALVVTEGSYTLEHLQLPFQGGALEIHLSSDAGVIHQLCLDGLLIGLGR